jgi:hypothetical protein
MKFAVKILILILFAALMFSECNNTSGKYEKGESLLKKVEKRTILKISKKYNLFLSAIGGGTDDQGIWLVNFMFDRRGKPYTIQESRAVIVDCIEELLSEINNDQEIRPYLKEYPFTPKNVSLTIISYDENGYDLVDPDLSVVSSSRGEINYSTTDPKNSYKYKLDIYESYEEAVAILKREKE